MNQHLQQAGLKLFKLLARHGESLMHAYVNGKLDEAKLDSKQVESLLKAGVIWRPSADEGLILSSNLRSLLEEALSDTRNRQIDANVGSRLETIKTLAAHYKEALHIGDLAAADVYLSDLNEHSYSLTESLRHSSRVLWSRINNEFGYVPSLSAKIRENELAQQQVGELLDSLSLLNFDTLSQIAGDIRELRRVLAINLSQAVFDCTQELAVVQTRLLTLLGRFRELRGKSRLLKGLQLFHAQHPDFSPQDPTSQVDVASLFNKAPALLNSASVDIQNPEHEQDLLHAVSQIHLQRQPHKLDGEPEHAVSLASVDEFSLQEQRIKQDVEDYLLGVIESAAGQTALEYYQQQQLSWDAEAWLYQVWGSYHALPEEQRDYFALDPIEDPHPIFSGNRIVRDLQVWLR
ncbi:MULTISPECIES: phosphoenolpyruvate carboxylase [unclassified Agarivorans]|uniref:phosphoenolpyruvate carboxylase n=1 Tax=unclassified Agarivorans TaxID=2636026 RepID=UPI0026E3B17E|nr:MULTISPECIES: phosphoenolpyruvate carboxylase [unclassified Agarivorans]MDO6685334.1 phosphoenolpyruvate carboxylase [Agarivorans sp. 3_MG-2023]MDO6715494.1 phosphoenolpyruvate carboxylase [Agarivorans sp. 2_MG-2023]